MALIKLIILVLVAILVVKGEQRLSAVVARDHNGYRAFTKKYFIAMTGGYFFILCGAMWHQQSVETGGNPSNGLYLGLLGLAMLGSVVYQHVRATNLTTGLGISAVQLPMYAVLAYLGSVVFVLFAGLYLAMPAAMGRARYVRVLD